MSRDYNLNRIPQGGREDDSRERETRLVRGEWSKARRESKTQPGGQGRNQNRPQNHQPQKQLKNVEGTSVTESGRVAREKKPAKATRRTAWRGNRLIYSTTIWYHKSMGCQWLSEKKDGGDSKRGGRECSHIKQSNSLKNNNQSSSPDSKKT